MGKLKVCGHRYVLYALPVLMCSFALIFTLLLAEGPDSAIAQSSPPEPQEFSTRDYYWTWYDSQGMQNWVLMANPQGSGEDLSFDLSVSDQKRDLAPFALQSATCEGGQCQPGVVPEGMTLAPKFDGLMGGPVKATSTTGAKGIVTQRMLMGNSFEEVLGTEANKLSDHFVWTWYDQKSAGAQDWVLVANPGDTPVTYEIRIAGELMPTSAENPGTIPASGKVTPTFPDKMDGPVELTASANVIASQRVIFGPSFEEVPGYPLGALTGDYHWSWYDQKNPGTTDWVLVANPGDTPVTYEIKIAGQTMPTSSDNPGIIPAHGKVTPTFADKMDGPVEVTASGNVMVSQRVLWNGYFNEVLGTVLS